MTEEIPEFLKVWTHRVTVTGDRVEVRVIGAGETELGGDKDAIGIGRNIVHAATEALRARVAQTKRLQDEKV